MFFVYLSALIYVGTYKNFQKYRVFEPKITNFRSTPRFCFKVEYYDFFTVALKPLKKYKAIQWILLASNLKIKRLEIGLPVIFFCI